MARVKVLLKRKGVATKPESTRSTQSVVQPQRQTADIPIDKLKNLLFAKLLSQSSVTYSDVDLVIILRSSSQPIEIVKALSGVWFAECFWMKCNLSKEFDFEGTGIECC